MTVSVSSRWNKGWCRLLLVLSGLPGIVVAGSVAAGEVMDSLQLHGFVSQGLVTTDDNNFFGPSSKGIGSLQYTEVGTNASLRPRHDVLLAAQVLSRRAGGDGREARPTLDYGVIDYQLPMPGARNWGLQLGRFKNPFGFYNQTRDVAFTRPSILLPQSIYFDRTRSLGLAADGVTVYAEDRLPAGVVRFQAGVGKPQVGEDLEQILRLDDQPGELDGRGSAIGQLRYEHDGERMVAALSAARVRARFDPGATGSGNGPGNGPGNGEFLFQPWIVSLQYNAQHWSLTGEYALRKYSLQGFNHRAWEQEVTGESWYLQYNRRFFTDWQWLLRYDVLYANRDDRSGRAFEQAGAGPAHAQFAMDWTLGLQWRFHPKVLFSAEYHRVNGTGWLPERDNPEPGQLQQRWDMLLFQTSLRF